MKTTKAQSHWRIHMKLNKSYVLATEVKGVTSWLDLPLFTLSTAEGYAKKLRELSPASTVLVVNTASE